MPYKKKDANTLEFEITLPARTGNGPATKELTMQYNRRNLRPGAEPRVPIRSRGQTEQLQQLQQKLERLRQQQGTQR